MVDGMSFEETKGSVAPTRRRVARVRDFILMVNLVALTGFGLSRAGTSALTTAGSMIFVGFAGTGLAVSLRRRVARAPAAKVDFIEILPPLMASRENRRCIVALARASGWLEVLSFFVPQRIAKEDIGDALESLCLLALRRGNRAWMIYLKATSKTFWIAINTLREYSLTIKRRIFSSR